MKICRAAPGREGVRRWRVTPRRRWRPRRSRIRALRRRRLLLDGGRVAEHQSESTAPASAPGASDMDLEGLADQRRPPPSASWLIRYKACVRSSGSPACELSPVLFRVSGARGCIIKAQEGYAAGHGRTTEGRDGRRLRCRLRHGTSADGRSGAVVRIQIELESIRFLFRSAISNVDNSCLISTIFVVGGGVSSMLRRHACSVSAPGCVNSHRSAWFRFQVHMTAATQV